MLINEIKQEGSSKTKMKVRLEGGTDFILYKKEINQYKLAEGNDLTEEVYERLLEEIFYPRAKKRAMHLLEQMDRTEEQLRQKLKDSGYPPEAVEEAINYVASFHYIDDERYAKAYIRSYEDSRSKSRLTQDLMKKGLSKELIQRCLEEEYQADEEAQILKLLKQKHYDPSTGDRKQLEKMYRFLLGRGYQAKDISRVIKSDELYTME